MKDYETKTDLGKKWSKNLTNNKLYIKCLFVLVAIPQLLIHLPPFFSSAPYRITVLEKWHKKKGGTTNGAPLMTSQMRAVQASGPGWGALCLLTLLRLTPAVSQGP